MVQFNRDFWTVLIEIPGTLTIRKRMKNSNVIYFFTVDSVFNTIYFYFNNGHTSIVEKEKEFSNLTRKEFKNEASKIIEKFENDYKTANDLLNKISNNPFE